jgi:hypothetical protein
MRSFVAGVVAAVLLAIVFGIALNFLQTTADREFQTEAVRL